MRTKLQGLNYGAYLGVLAGVAARLWDLGVQPGDGGLGIRIGVLSKAVVEPTFDKEMLQ